MSLDILDSIDGTLRDFGVSRDAMRWQPEEKREALPQADLAVDFGPLIAWAEEAGRALARFFDDVGRVLAPLLATLAEADEQWRERRRGGGKLAVDGHAYQRRLAARRKRRRR